MTVQPGAFPPDPRLLRKTIEAPDHALDLPARVRTCLRREEIKTIGDLIAKTPWDLLEIRNFGHVALGQVQRELDKINLRLRDDFVPLNTTKEN